MNRRFNNARHFGRKVQEGAEEMRGRMGLLLDRQMSRGVSVYSTLEFEACAYLIES
jgi:hypothetical protein